MNKTETINIIMMLKIGFPNWANKQTEEETVGLVNLWAMMLAEFDYKQVETAIVALIRSEDWCPPIAKVIDKIEFIASGGVGELSEQEAWAILSKAIRNSMYNSVEEFNKLPESIQKCVGNAGQLKTYALTGGDVVQTVIGSNFSRSFKAVMKKEREFQALPHETKLQIENKRADAEKLKQLSLTIGN